MKRLRTLTFSLATLLVTLSFFLLFKNRAWGKTEPVWQLSESYCFQLGVRDKYGELGEFGALFVVKDSKGKSYRAKRTVYEDDWGYVHFPTDFPTWNYPGKYTWGCYVNGKRVVGGKFEVLKDGRFIGSY